jgi:hypothetical protein
MTLKEVFVEKEESPDSNLQKRNKMGKKLVDKASAWE